MILELSMILISAIVVALIGYPIVKWIDKTRKEMDEQYDDAE